MKERYNNKCHGWRIQSQGMWTAIVLFFPFFRTLDIFSKMLEKMKKRTLFASLKIKEMADSENPEHRRIFWLLNKSGEAAFRRETERFPRIKFDIEQAAIPQESVYRAAYSCTQPYFVCEKAALAGINSLAHKISESI